MTHRALVVGVVGPDDPAQRHRAEGADLLAAGDPSTVPADLPVVALDGPELTTLGELVVPLPAAGVDREAALATVALAVTRGARVVLTRDVHGTRRVVDVLAAILARR